MVNLINIGLDVGVDRERVTIATRDVSGGINEPYAVMHCDSGTLRMRYHHLDELVKALQLARKVTASNVLGR
jgi:RNase P/RNase MRP subunit POP5